MLGNLWAGVKAVIERIAEFFKGGPTELSPEEVVGSVIKKTLSKVDRMVDDYVVESWGALVDELKFLGTTLFTLYIVYFGYQLLVGRTRLTMGEAAGRVVKMLVVYVFFLSTPVVLKKAYEFLNDTPQARGCATPPQRASQIAAAWRGRREERTGRHEEPKSKPGAGGGHRRAVDRWTSQRRRARQHAVAVARRRALLPSAFGGR